MKKGDTGNLIIWKTDMASIMGKSRHRKCLGLFLGLLFLLNWIDPASAFGEVEYIIFKPDQGKSIADTDRKSISEIERTIRALINDSGLPFAFMGRVSKASDIDYYISGHTELRYFISGEWSAKETKKSRDLVLRLNLYEKEAKSEKNIKGKWDIPAERYREELLGRVIPEIHKELRLFVIFGSSQHESVNDLDKGRIPYAEKIVRKLIIDSASGLHFYFPGEKTESFYYIDGHPMLRYYLEGLWLVKKTKLTLRLTLKEKGNIKKIGEWDLSNDHMDQDLRDRVIPKIKDKIGIKRPKGVYAHCVFFQSIKDMPLSPEKTIRLHNLQRFLTIEYPDKLEEKYPKSIRVKFIGQHESPPEYHIVYHIDSRSYPGKCTNENTNVSVQDIGRVDYLVEGLIIPFDDILLVTGNWIEQEESVTEEQPKVNQRCRSIPIASTSKDLVVYEMGKKIVEIIATNKPEKCKAT